MKTTPRCRRAPSARRRGRLCPDDGTSLIELMVGMMLMLIFMGMFTGAVVMMNTALNKAQAVNLTSSQLNTAFLNLDTTVRYASAIGDPVKVTSGDWYVEFRSTDFRTVTTGQEVCTQLKVSLQQLQRRTWTFSNGAANNPTTWIPIASGISNGGAAVGAVDQPFVRLAPGGNRVLQQLTINLTSPTGSGASLTNSMSSFTFTALNSTIAAPVASTCQEWPRS